MSDYTLINGCTKSETLRIFKKLMSYPCLVLDMAVVPESNGQEVVLCTFDYNGLKMGFEVDSDTNALEVSCFVSSERFGTQSSESRKEMRCRLGTSTLSQIYDYLDLKLTGNADFKDFYRPSGIGLARYINMTICL